MPSNADADLHHIEADTAALRAQRDELRAEERRLSYVRRVVQGHLDLAAAELRRRDVGEGEALVAHVTKTLAGPASAPARAVRAVGLYEPANVADEFDDIAVIRLPDLARGELVAHIERLQRRERALSDRRAVLLGRLDRVQATLVARYRDDQTAIAAVSYTMGGT